MACKSNNQCDFCDARCPDYYEDQKKDVKLYILTKIKLLFNNYYYKKYIYHVYYGNINAK